MKEIHSIQIQQPIETVFDLVTDPNRFHEWSTYVRRVEILSRGSWGGFDQARFILVRGNLEVELVETVIKYERPTLVTSKFHILRSTRRPNNPSQGDLPPNGEIDFPKERVVEKRFKNEQRTVIEQMDFIPEGENSMTLRMTSLSHLGLLHSVVAWTNRILRRSQLAKTLEAIKKAAESSIE